MLTTFNKLLITNSELICLRMNKKNYLFCLLLLISIDMFSQVAVPFAVRRQMYVKGDMTMIANNIVNRKDFFSSPNSPYDKIDDKSKLNDQFDMQYIDIDDDNTTFSSSSATLTLETPKEKRIVYAGLYWSATYTTNSSKNASTNVFTAVDATRETFDKIKIKLPNGKSYTDIQGKLIFDGYEKPSFKESAPYAMYADITELVKNTNSPLGTYTVANIKSTVGTISGGVSGGWTILFVYEDLAMTGKFITTYDGFAGVTKTAVDIDFSGFQTLPTGTISAKIACAALEGDLSLVGDQIYFKAEYGKEFSNISDVLRQKTNVFNSSISIDDKYFTERVPNSVNTLGYDSFIMTIQNPNNSIIKNGITGATIKFKSYGDRYFVFFNAFNVEVVPPTIENLQEIVEPADLLVKTINKEAPEEMKTSPKLIAAKTVVKSVQKESPKALVVESPIVKSEIKENTIVNTTKTDNARTARNLVGKEYYLVAGVFKVHANATKLIAKLKTQGIAAYYITNPRNKYRYVYISKNDTYNETSKLYANKLNGQYSKKTWVFGLTKQTNSSIVENKSLDKQPGILDKSIDTAENEKPAKIVLNSGKKKSLISNPLGSNSTKRIVLHNKDYYLVVGVFRVHTNASNLVARLRNNGVDAYSFVNSKNKLKYVYVSKNKSFKIASSLCQSKLNGTYNKDIWILGVNQENTIVSSD